MSEHKSTGGGTNRIEIFDHPALLNACMQDWFMIGLQMVIESDSPYQIELHCAREENNEGRYSTLYELRVSAALAGGAPAARTFGVMLAVKEMTQ